VIFPVKGNSMLPFIIGDKDKVEFHPIKHPLHIGDIIMARVDEGYPVVHRIVGIDGDRITLTGDGNLGFKEHCHRQQVIAQGMFVVDQEGNKKSLTSQKALRKWRRWNNLRPIRRILLKIFKIYKGIK